MTGGLAKAAESAKAIVVGSGGGKSGDGREDGAQIPGQSAATERHEAEAFMAYTTGPVSGGMAGIGQSHNPSFFESTARVEALCSGGFVVLALFATVWPPPTSYAASPGTSTRVL